MATGSKHELYLTRETAYGGAPQIPDLKVIPITGTTLALTKDTFQSNLLRKDRQIQDFRHGMKQVGGNVEVEMKGHDYDDLLANLFSNEWLPIASETIDANNEVEVSGDIVTLNAGDWAALGFEVGHRVDMTGWINEENNITGAEVLAFPTADTMQLAGAAFVDEPSVAGAPITIATVDGTLQLGDKRFSFTAVREFADIAGADDFVYHGVEVNTFDLTVAANAIITASFGTIGKNQSFIPDYIETGTVTPASDSSVMDAFSGQLSEGGTPIATVTEITLNIDNGMEVRPVIGSDSTLRPGQTRFNCTGQLTAYFEDIELLRKFLEETDTSLSFEIRGKDGRSYTFALPRISFSGGQPDVPDEGDVMLTMPFQALLETTAGTNLTITRK